MRQHVEFGCGVDIATNRRSEGLAPIVCYDPWFARTLESIKQSVVDGHPVLVRLHSAAAYPVASAERYTNDLESHAVLVVGYDDTRQAVEVIDPWNRKWGGIYGGRRWLPYAGLGIEMVDSSLGMAMTLAPLEVHLQPRCDKDDLYVDLQVGFYTPRGTVMDQASWAITEIEIGCTLPWEDTRVSYTFQGAWVVGKAVKRSLHVSRWPSQSAQIEVDLSAKIQGDRPYRFCDRVTHCQTVMIDVCEAEPAAYATA